MSRRLHLAIISVPYSHGAASDETGIGVHREIQLFGRQYSQHPFESRQKTMMPKIELEDIRKILLCTYRQAEMLNKTALMLDVRTLTKFRAIMKYRIVTFGIVFCCLSILAVNSSAFAGPKEDCEIVLKTLGYSLTSYEFEEAGWLSKEKHIFNGSQICYINSKQEIYSIEDNDVVIVKDGFYGKAALDKRDELNTERRAAIKEERRKVEEEKNLIDERLEETEQKINEAFDRKIEKVKLSSEPPATAAAREARRKKNEAAHRAEEKKIAREKAEAEEAQRRAEEERQKAREIARQVRQAEVDAIKRRTGSTVSLDISDAIEKACADLLAGLMRNIDVHFVQSESIWGDKFSVWYRDRDINYGTDLYHFRNCQISGESVKILSIFQNWE